MDRLVLANELVKLAELLVRGDNGASDAARYLQEALEDIDEELEEEVEAAEELREVADVYDANEARLVKNGNGFIFPDGSILAIGEEASHELVTAMDESWVRKGMIRYTKSGNELNVSFNSRPTSIQRDVIVKMAQDVDIVLLIFMMIIMTFWGVLKFQVMNLMHVN